MAMFTSNPPAAKFSRIGDSVAGEIVEVYKTQRYEYVRGGQGQPLYWHNRKPVAGARRNPETGALNDPVLQTVIVIDTGAPDENGDTERRLFIKNKRMEKSLTAAVTAAGGRRIGGLLLGGRLVCAWVGEEDGDGPQPAKVYQFAYTPPPAGTGREPGDEVRLAEREPEPDIAPPGRGILRDRIAVDEPPAYAPPSVYSGAVPYPGAPSREQAAGDAWATAPAAVSREALATARSGVRETDVSAGVGGRARPAVDDEPPF